MFSQLVAAHQHRTDIFRRLINIILIVVQYFEVLPTAQTFVLWYGW